MQHLIFVLFVLAPVILLMRYPTFAHEVSYNLTSIAIIAGKKSPLKSHNLFALLANGLASIFIIFDSVEVLTLPSPIPSCFLYC